MVECAFWTSKKASRFLRKCAISNAVPGPPVDPFPKPYTLSSKAYLEGQGDLVGRVMIGITWVTM